MPVSARLRRALPWVLAFCFSAIVLVAGSRDVFWTGDFYLEVYPAYFALMHGDVAMFKELLPGYSGFTVAVGAPSALLTDVFGGAETMVYRFTAVPGLLALSAVGVAVAGPVRAAGNRAWPVFLLAGAGGVLGWEVLRAGHPEDLLATGAAVGAVLTALKGRIGWSSVLLVVAVGAKQSMLVAVLPAALAAPRGGLRIAASGVIGAAVIVLLQTQVHGSEAHGAITNTGLLFHPHQVFWPFGIPATPEFIAAGHGTRMGPEWLAPLTRPLIIGTAFAVSALWWLRTGPDRNRVDALGVLALVLLLRCMLDPWNLVYYHLPLVVALAAWEAYRGRSLPALSVVTTAACWLTFVVYDERTGNGPFFAYLAWTIPLAAGLAFTLLRPGRAERPARAPRAAAPVPA